jgi:hypothetical protein
MSDAQNRWKRPGEAADARPGAPEHPVLTRRDRVEERIFWGVVTTAGVGMPAAVGLAIEKVLGGAVLGAGVAMLVIVAGVLLARSSGSPRAARDLVADARERGVAMSSEEARMATRHGAQVVGCAIAVAGGIGLAFAFAAL